MLHAMSQLGMVKVAHLINLGLTVTPSAGPGPTSYLENRDGITETTSNEA